MKEAVKLGITPLIASLSILNHVDIDSESEMLGNGISVILLNVGIYFVAPAFVIYRLRAAMQKEQEKGTPYAVFPDNERKKG